MRIIVKQSDRRRIARGVLSAVQRLQYINLK